MLNTRLIALMLLVLGLMPTVWAAPFAASGAGAPQQACEEWKKPSKAAVTPFYSGDGRIGCKMVVDGQEQTQYWVTETACPVYGHGTSMTTCDCDEGYGLRGNACVEGAPSAPGVQAATGSAGSADCALEELSGNSLTNAVVGVLERYTQEENAAFIADHETVASSLPLNIGRGFFTGDYGTLLENLVARRLESDACLSKFVRHLTQAQQTARGPSGEKASHPDFEGIGKLPRSFQVDITTAALRETKLRTDGAKANYHYIIYKRGLCFVAATRTLRRIPDPDDPRFSSGNCPPTMN